MSDYPAEAVADPDTGIVYFPDEAASPPGDLEPAADQPADQPTEAPAEGTPGWYARHDGGGGLKRDWDIAKRMYVEGVKTDTGIDYLSMDEVARRLGYPANRTREKGARDGWRAERAQWQAQVEQQRRVNRANAMSQKATQLDNDAGTVATTGLTLVQAKMTEIAQLAQRARSEAGPGGGSGTAIDPLELTRLAQAADLFHKIGLRAVGDPETHRLEITGAGGAPIEIAAELRRDDPTRISSVLAVLQQAGLDGVLPELPAGGYRARPADEDIVDVEYEEEDDDDDR